MARPRRSRQAVPFRELGERPPRRVPRAAVIALPIIASLGLVALALSGPAAPPSPSAPAGAVASASGAPGTDAATSLPTDALPSPAPSGPSPTGDGIGEAPVDGTGTLEPHELDGYGWPVRRARLSAFYDWRDTGFFRIGDRRLHAGLDLTTFCGDAIRAAHAGTVLAAGRRAPEQMGFDGSLEPVFQRLERRDGDLGALSLTVVIDDGNGYRSAYLHLSSLRVQPGDQVRRGQVIGEQGATGNASGCHLHWELIRMDGPWMDVAREFVDREGYPPRARLRVDPYQVLDPEDRFAARLIPGIDPPEVPPGSSPAP